MEELWEELWEPNLGDQIFYQGPTTRWLPQIAIKIMLSTATKLWEPNLGE